MNWFPEPETKLKNTSEYIPIAEIARGGMARVLLARKAGHGGFSRLFALKVLHTHLAQEREYVEMLLDEADLASGVHHPNVVGILDVGRLGSTFYLVMEYVEGCTLAHLLGKLLEAPPERPVAQIVRIALDVLAGLDAAHRLKDVDGESRELIHRDVSPGNVLVGVDGVARLTDFGVAKARSRLTSTEPGIAKGKFSYMAPEQITGRPIDNRVDLFSFGVMLHNALTGMSLFQAGNEAATLQNVLDKPIPRPSQAGLSRPEAAPLDDVVLWALQRDPDARPRSALALRQELERVASEAGLIAHRDEVKAWVGSVAGEALRERRRQLRAHVRKGMTTGTFRALGPTALARVRPSSVPEIPRIEQTPATVAARPARFGRRPSNWVIGVAAALAVLVVGTGLVSVFGPDEGARADVTAARDAAVPPRSVRTVPAPAVAEEPRGEVAAASVPAPPDTEPSAEDTADAHALERRRRARRRRSPLRRMDPNPYAREE